MRCALKRFPETLGSARSKRDPAQQVLWVGRKRALPCEVLSQVVFEKPQCGRRSQIALESSLRGKSRVFFEMYEEILAQVDQDCWGWEKISYSYSRM